MYVLLNLLIYQLPLLIEEVWSKHPTSLSLLEQSVETSLNCARSTALSCETDSLHTLTVEEETIPFLPAVS